MTGAAMADDVNALLGGKQEMDALTLIAWIRKILAQPHAQRNLDAYAELIRQLCKARHAALVEAGEPMTFRGQALTGHAVGPAPWGTGGDEGTIARARRSGFAQEMVRDGSNKEALLVLVRVHGQDDLFLALDLSPFDRGRVNEIVIRCMLVTDLSERGAGGSADQSGRPAARHAGAGGRRRAPRRLRRRLVGPRQRPRLALRPRLRGAGAHQRRPRPGWAR